MTDVKRILETSWDYNPDENRGFMKQHEYSDVHWE